jgi:hypothetical protein
MYRNGGILLVCVMILQSGTSCSRMMGSSMLREDSWAVDQSIEVKLVHYMSDYPASDDPDMTFSDFSMHFIKDGDERKIPLGRREMAEIRRIGHYNISHLEMRSDDQSKRFWVVDRARKKVVASYDFEHEQATGIEHDPPGWAIVGGGDLVPKIDRPTREHVK